MGTAIATYARRSRVRSLTDQQLLVLFGCVAVIARLPLLVSPLGIDEGGYALVASQWGSGQGSLYGAQWVDRPPLLIALFALAIAVAGDIGIRLLGCVSAFVAVWACGRAALRFGGRSASIWTSVTAIALVSSIATQGQLVNAEIPAIACTAVSMWCCIEALASKARRSACGWAVAAGLAASAALLTKQSHADALVFAGAALVAASWTRRAMPSTSRSPFCVAYICAGGLAGVMFAFAAAAAVTVWAGPGIGPMFDAAIAFRIDARNVIDAGAGAPARRAWILVIVATISGIVPLVVLAGGGLLRRTQVRFRSPLQGAVRTGLVVSLAFGVLAIAQGGNWWLHYLLQIVPALAIATGYVATVADRDGSNGADRWSRMTRRTVVYVCAACAISIVCALGWSALVGLRQPSHAAASWLAAARAPGDTGIVTWGHPDVLYSAGLTTPYELSWSLPVRVRDPHLTQLRAVVRGSKAPTWIIQWNDFDTWNLDEDGRLGQLVRQRYNRVGSLCGHAVYRLRESGGSTRSVPPMPTDSSCGREPSVFGVRLA